MRILSTTKTGVYPDSVSTSYKTDIAYLVHILIDNASNVQLSEQVHP